MSSRDVVIGAAIVAAGVAIGAGLYLGGQRNDGEPAGTPPIETQSTQEPEEDVRLIEPLPLEANSAAEELARRYGQTYCGDPYINGQTLDDGAQVFVPECLDTEGDPTKGELAVIAFEDEVSILQQGQVACHVNLRATTQDELCE